MIHTNRPGRAFQRHGLALEGQFFLHAQQRTHARSVGEAGYRDDHYWLARGDGQTRIVDTDDTPGNVDTLTLVQNIQLHNLWLTQVGQDLRLSVLGTRDDATIANWFQGAAYRVERIERLLRE